MTKLEELIQAREKIAIKIKELEETSNYLSFKQNHETDVIITKYETLRSENFNQRKFLEELLNN